MKLSQTHKIIDEFIKDETMSAILIDGAWGIGKTHTLLSYVEKNKKKKKFAYVSLFGKEDLDEINTDLYYQIYPSRKFLNVVSHVIKLAEAGISTSCGFNVNLGGYEFTLKKKIKKKKKKQIVVIFDDLERRSENINDDNLIGYFNELLLQGIKIIILSNLNNANSEKLGVYKEKVFDRIYKISETEDEIVANILGSNHNLINKEILNMLDNNLRMIRKTNSLYTQVIKHLNDKKVEHSINNELFVICACVVKETLTEMITKEYKETASEESKKYFNLYSISQFRRMAIDKLFRTKFGTPIDGFSSLIDGVFLFFEENDFAILDACFATTQDNEDQLFKTSIFYMSDENKIKTIRKQYKYIINLDKLNDGEQNVLESAIREWFAYGSYLDFSMIDENKLFKSIFKLELELDTFMCENVRFREFKNRYLEAEKKLREKQIKEQLNTNSRFELYNHLKDLKHSFSGYSKEVQSAIEKHMVSQSFYITSIHGDIDSFEWKLAHLICDFVGNYARSLVNKLNKYLKGYKQKHPDDLSLQNRIDGLISQYHLEMKKTTK